MPTRRELVLLQRNTETVELTFTQEDTQVPQDLTGVTVEVYIKPDATTPDDDAATTLLSTANGGGIAVSPPASNGVAVMTVPDVLTATAGESWWRVDCVIGGSRKTAMYGPFVVRDT